MPKVLSECYSCDRKRELWKLEMTHIEELGDGTDTSHYRLVCKDECRPTRWEAFFERRQERAAQKQLLKWVTEEKR